MRKMTRLSLNISNDFTAAASKLMFAFLAICLGATISTEARASDFSNNCRSADGQYRIDDGVLKSTNNRKAIKYRTLNRRKIRHKRGYCTDNRKKNTPYQYEYQSYSLTVEFKINGKSVEKDFACELYADGLPAGLNCDREIKLLDFKASK